MSLRESIYQIRNFQGVAHTTLNPYGPGVVRIHMIPPKFQLFKAAPSVVILNGKDILPVNLSWAILLNEFILQVNRHGEKEVTDEVLNKMVHRTLKQVRKVYPFTKNQHLKEDLWTIVDTLCDIAYGRAPKEEVGYLSLGEYAPHMTAPHRMDLCVSAMTKDGQWHCNQKCLHCYAAGQELAGAKELSTSDWKEIIDRCHKAGIPQLTFTGGEPTLRADLPELIYHARWFVTRLNTNGVLMTKQLCKKLYQSELDSVQITFYSAAPEEHNQLVGAKNFEATRKGILNALHVGLNVSINTPLCTINRNYVKTLEYLHELGVEYVTCSGLIITGNATTDASKNTQLSESELLDILKEATAYCKENHMEISFTSPGWIKEDQVRGLGLNVPSCGACLSNMAIAPDGSVIPCQSWLNGTSLGNMLTSSWKSIWNNSECKKRRAYSSRMELKCPFREEQGGAGTCERN